MQSVSRLAVWYVLLQGSSRWSTISVSREFDSGVCDVGNRVDGLVHQVAGKALGPANKHVRSEVGSRYPEQLHAMQSVSRLAVWYVLL